MARQRRRSTGATWSQRQRRWRGASPGFTYAPTAEGNLTTSNVSLSPNTLYAPTATGDAGEQQHLRRGHLRGDARIRHLSRSHSRRTRYSEARPQDELDYPEVFFVERAKHHFLLTPICHYTETINDSVSDRPR